MKIAVNTRLLLPNKLEGIGRFEFEILSRLVKLRPQDEFIFIFDRPFSKEFIFSENVRGISLFPPTRHPLLFKWFFDYSLPSLFKKEKVEVFLSPDGFLSLNSDIPQIQVIHDINFAHHPEYLPLKWSRYYNQNFPKYAQMARSIVAVSEFTKNDISNTYGISKDKIYVAYNSAGEGFRPTDSDRVKKIRLKYTEGEPYFLFVGLLHPRKNISRLLESFDIFKMKTGSSYKLLIAGQQKWSDSEIETAFEKMKFRKDVIFSGRANQEDLCEIYSAAFALTYFSLYEGFGIPILEGFLSGIPVLTSNCTAMPEIGGNACLYANPEDTEMMAEQMIQISQSPALVNDLVENGAKRAKLFKWENSAVVIKNLL